MIKIKKNGNINPNGTSFHNDTILASVNDLWEIFGDPNSNGDEDKVTKEWILEVTEDGKVYCCTIYDWKEYRHFRDFEEIYWHIGAKTASESHAAYMEIQRLLKKVRDDKFKENVMEYRDNL